MNYSFRLIFTAEREGFEPSVPFWGTHAFQASPFDRSGTSPKIELFPSARKR